MHIRNAVARRLAVACTAATTVLGLSPLHAQDSETSAWRLSVGPAVQQIDEVHFKRSQIRNPALGDTPYVNFAAQGSAWKMMDPAVQAPGGYVPNGAYSTAFALADQAAWRGARNRPDAWGGTLDLSRTFLRRGNWSGLLRVSLSALELNANAGGSAAPGATRGFDTAHAGFAINAPTPPVDPTLTSVTATGDWGNIGGSVLGPQGTTAGLSTARIGVRSDLDARLYELSLGCGAAYSLGRVRLSAATGPLVTLADMRTSQRQTVQTGDSTSFWHNSDSSTDWLFGWSIRCGADVRITSRISLGVGVHYDQLAGTASTRHASVDPSGFGADMRLGVTF